MRDSEGVEDLGVVLRAEFAAAEAAVDGVTARRRDCAFAGTVGRCTVEQTVSYKARNWWMFGFWPVAKN